VASLTLRERPRGCVTRCHQGVLRTSRARSRALEADEFVERVSCGACVVGIIGHA
jgi:hypothetical protein